MRLSSNLVTQFVKATNDSSNEKQETTLYGTIVTSGNTNYVRLDGSEILTPISSTTTASDGDRVAVMVKDHSAVVTGNISDPAQNGKSTDDKVASAVSEFEIIIADKVSTKELDAQVGRIDDLVAENVTIKDNLTANSASIDDLTAKNVTVEKTLTANSADIKTLKTSTITAEDADLKYATIENLNVANETVHNLSGDYASFKATTTTDFSAVNARIDNITGSVITTEFLDANYAQIDLANIAAGSIKSAMIEQSAIGTAQIADGSITDAKIVGLTANKITAGRLDAATIEVVNLNAANITVGTINGQQIAQGAINVGNLSQSLSGTISSASDNALNAIEIANDAKSNTIYSVDVMYALSSSETSEPTTGWSTTAPPWQSGKYMWQKTVTTYGDNTKEESSATCITGAAGQNGTNGKDGLNGTAGESIKTVTNYYLASSSSSGITTSTSGWTTTIQTISSSKPYLWNYEIAKGSSGTTLSITSPIIIGHFGTDGATGSTGATGIGISTITEYYQVSTSNSTAPTSWIRTVPTLTATNKYLWNYETITYTNNTTKDTLKRVIGAYGDKGSTGAQGATGKGVKSIQEQYYLSTSNTSQTGGSWATAQPTWTSGKYIWTSSHITWSDNTTTDTTPILADAINKANSTASTASSNASTALSTANTANSTANSAQTTANGKNTVYYQTAAPSGGAYKTNDIWFDTDDGNRMYSWSGSAWVTKQFGTNAIANLAITNAQIADGTIQNAKISNLDAGKITTGYISADRIKANSITATQIAAATITADKIATGTITATQIAATTITGDNLVAATITGAKIAAKTITANNMVANTITAASGIIADAAITNAKIKSLDAAKITTGYISADRIKAGSITADKLTVTDLQAIGATIGGFTIRQDSLTMGGTYLADDASHFFQADCIYIGKSGISYNNTFCIRSDGSLLSQDPSVSTSTCMINSGSINFGTSGRMTMSYINPDSGYDTPITRSVLYFGVKSTTKGPISVSNLVNNEINIVASGGINGYINMKASSTVGIRAPYIYLDSDDVSIKDKTVLYVVASGTSGLWNYRKTNDGCFDAWGRINVNSGGGEINVASAYVGLPFSATSYVVSAVNCQPNTPSNSYYYNMDIEVIVSNLKTNNFYVSVHRGTAGYISSNGTWLVDVIVKGRWV